MKGAYRPPQPGAGFRFPFRRRTMGTGGYNAPTPGRPSKSMPSIKQFSQMKPGHPKPKVK